MARDVRVVLAVAAVATAVVVAAAAPAAGAELVVVAGGETAATLPVEAAATVTFPFEVAAGVDATKLKGQLVRFRRDGREIAADGALSVGLDLAVPAVVFRVTSLERAATYTALVQLTVEDGRRQHVTFTLTRPAAAITVPTKLVAERTLGVVGDGVMKEKRPGLRLRAGADSRATVTLSQVEDESGEVTFGSQSQFTLEPNVPQPVPYGLDRDFPLGTVTRTVEVRSDQLADPLRVPIEVTTRRTRWMIPLLIFIGAVAGLVSRYTVPRLRNWATATRSAAALRGQLKGLAESRGDERFRRDIEGALAHLSQSFQGRRDVEAGVKAARAEAEKAVAALDARVTLASDRHVATKAVVVASRDVPRDVAAELEPARKGADDAGRALATLDAEGADAALDVAASALDRAGQKSGEWLQRYEHALAMIDAATTTVTHRAGALFAVRSAAAAAAARLVVAPADRATAASDKLDALDAVGSAFEAVRRWVRELADEVDELDAALAGADLGVHASRLRTVGARDETGLEDLAQEVAGLLDKLKEAAPAQVHALIDQGNLRQAAVRAVDVRLGRQPAADGPDVDGAGPATETPEPPRRDTIVLPVAVPSVWSQIALVPAYTAVVVAKGVAAFLQFLVSSAVAMLVGYPLFADEWTGTVADVTKVVAWAFAADLGVEGLKRLAASTAPPAAPAGGAPVAGPA